MYVEDTVLTISNKSVETLKIKKTAFPLLVFNENKTCQNGLQHQKQQYTINRTTQPGTKTNN